MHRACDRCRAEGVVRQPSDKGVVLVFICPSCEGHGVLPEGADRDFARIYA